MNVLRVAAAIGVMGVHFASHLHGQLSLPLDRLESVNIVDLFFVLSGFILFHIYADKVDTTKKHWHFLRLRFARLYPLHALTCMFFIGVGYLSLVANHPPRVASTFQVTSGPCHLLLLQAWNMLGDDVGLNGPSWSLSAEFFLLLLFPSLTRLLEKVGPLAGAVVAIAAAVAFAATRQHLGLRPWSEATFDFGIFRALPFFMMGMIVAQIIRRHPDWTVSWVMTAGVGLFVLAALVFGAPQSLSLLTFPLFVGLLTLSDRRYSPTVFAHKTVGFLANLTFGIFLLHTIFGILLVSTLRAFHIESVPIIVGMMIVFAGATIAAAAVAHTYFEQPMRARLAPGRQGANKIATKRETLGHIPVAVTQRI